MRPVLIKNDWGFSTYIDYDSNHIIIVKVIGVSVILPQRSIVLGLKGTVADLITGQNDIKSQGDWPSAVRRYCSTKSLNVLNLRRNTYHQVNLLLVSSADDQTTHCTALTILGHQFLNLIFPVDNHVGIARWLQAETQECIIASRQINRNCGGTISVELQKKSRYLPPCKLGLPGFNP